MKTSHSLPIFERLVYRVVHGYLVLLVPSIIGLLACLLIVRTEEFVVFNNNKKQITTDSSTSNSKSPQVGKGLNDPTPLVLPSANSIIDSVQDAKIDFYNDLVEVDLSKRVVVNFIIF